MSFAVTLVRVADRLWRHVSRRFLGPLPTGMLPLRPMPVPSVDEENHPEALALRPFCSGRGIDVGCGHRKVAPECVGVDLTAPGKIGRYGVTAGKIWGVIPKCVNCAVP
jgi:hypothetical protein